MMACVVTRAEHTLQDIHDTGEGGDGIRKIVRWCSACGAIVRDVEVDGRLLPGDLMPMRFPTLAALAAQKGGA